jgi:hypothetical protein
MNLPDLDAIQQALSDRLHAKVSGLKFQTRRYLTFDQIPAEKQPAMIVAFEEGNNDRVAGMPSKWPLSAYVIFYVREPNDKSKTSETTIFDLLKQTDAALARQPTELYGDDLSTTLGGLVWHCWISRVEVFTGPGEQAGARLTISMLVI